MKKFFAGVSIMFIMFYASASFSITLRFANYFPPASAQSQLCEKIIKDLEKTTGGKVKFSYHPGETLLTAKQMYEGVTKGVADIGLSNIGYTYGRFKVTEVLNLPIGFPNAWVSNHVVNDFYRKYKPAEWNDVIVLALHTCPVYTILSKQKKVKKLEDLRGMALRAIGEGAFVVQALGGVPRSIPMSEAYDGLVKGVIDGLYTPMETLKTWKFAEIVKYVTECWPIGQVNIFYLIMNKNTWEKLPDDVKKVFNQYPFEDEFAKMWNEIDLEGLRYGKEKGIEFVSLSPEEAQLWKTQVEGVIAEYVEKMKKEGFSESEIRDWITFARGRISYWLKRQMELGIKSSTGPDEVRVQ